MPTASRHTEQLAHAAHIVRNASSYARRPRIVRAAITRLRMARAPKQTATIFQFPQADLNDRAADIEQARRARNASAKAVAVALTIAIVFTVCIARTAYLGALGFEATMAQADALRGM